MRNIALFSSALDAALAFQQQFVVPSAWKTEVKEESSSSEDDEDEEEEEQEEDASGGEEEVEDEKLTHLHQNLEAKHRFYKRINIYIHAFFFFLLFPAHRRKWSRSQRNGRTSCSSCTSSWKTEVKRRLVLLCSNAQFESTAVKAQALFISNELRQTSYSAVQFALCICNFF